MKGLLTPGSFSSYICIRAPKSEVRCTRLTSDSTCRAHTKSYLYYVSYCYPLSQPGAKKIAHEKTVKTLTTISRGSYALTKTEKRKEKENARTSIKYFLKNNILHSAQEQLPAPIEFKKTNVIL